MNWPNFSRRSDDEELMDDLLCEGPVVEQTLRELHTINTLLGGNQISIEAFKKIATKLDKVQLVDLGCGGGDILKILANWCRRKGLKAQFMGVDANPNIIAYAEANCADYPEIQFKPLDVLAPELHELEFNVAHCCLFAHHFQDKELVSLIRQLAIHKGARVIINDLHRHPLAYYSIALLTQLFSKSAMVRYDSKISVLRGFSRGELKQLLDKAKIPVFSIRWKWAFRWQIVI